VEQLVEEREKNGEFKDLQDFISRMGSQAHNKRFLESMISGGAFDCFGVPRSQMMAVYDQMVEQVANDRKFQSNGQMSLFDSVLKEDAKVNKIQYPNIREYPDQQRLRMEKDVLGIYVSGHPLEQYRAKLKSFNLNSGMLRPTIIEGEDVDDNTVVYDQVTDGMRVTCGGIINSIRKMTTKLGNKDMAVIVVEDFQGTYEAIIFPKAYSEVKNKLAVDNMVTIKGRVSIREGEAPSIAVEDVTLWEDEEKPQSQTQNFQYENNVSDTKLYLKYDLTDSVVNNEIYRVLRNYPGNSQVVAKCTAQNKAFMLPFKVNNSVAMQNELLGILSEDCVKIK